MKPEFVGGNVRANCPTCGGAVTTFEYAMQGNPLGSVVIGGAHHFNNRAYSHIYYQLMRCAGCHQGALAEVHTIGDYPGNGALERFFPCTVDKLPVPAGVPDGVKKEFEEAETCASVQAWRAGSALLRSTLEKTLQANGYTKGTLAARINDAAADGAITASRAQRAHENIRVLGNDVVHDEWREVTEEEFNDSHRYAQRILEDLYDDRPSVEALLKAKGRLA